MRVKMARCVQSAGQGLQTAARSAAGPRTGEILGTLSRRRSVAKRVRWARLRLLPIVPAGRIMPFVRPDLFGPGQLAAKASARLRLARHREPPRRAPCGCSTDLSSSFARIPHLRPARQPMISPAAAPPCQPVSKDLPSRKLIRRPSNCCRILSPHRHSRERGNPRPLGPLSGAAEVGGDAKHTTLLPDSVSYRVQSVTTARRSRISETPWAQSLEI